MGGAPEGRASHNSNHIAVDDQLVILHMNLGGTMARLDNTRLQKNDGKTGEKVPLD